jgi:hypothetical protein
MVPKRLRFEVFKRDRFRCVYCGANPVDDSSVLLQVDHIVPASKGGVTDEMNLLTSCRACNAGKGAVPLEVKLVPLLSREEMGSKAEQVAEHAEQVAGYIEALKALSAARRKTARSLADYWEETVGPMSEEMFGHLCKLAGEWPVSQLMEAMDITGRKLGSVGFGFNGWSAIQQKKYFNAILRNWREWGRRPDDRSPSTA